PRRRGRGDAVRPAAPRDPASALPLVRRRLPELPRLPVGQSPPRVRAPRALPALQPPGAPRAPRVPPASLQALFRVGHRQVEVPPRRLAGGRRDDLLLRARAAADVPRRDRAPSAGLVAPRREPRGPGPRAAPAVRDLRAAKASALRARGLLRVPARQPR